jgi:hypothetical protein
MEREEVHREMMTPGKTRRLLYKLSILCILVNFIVKVGLVYQWQCKTILLMGAIIDMCGVLLVAKLSKPL